MPSENPIQLLEMIVRKDKGAFERFYDLYASLVYGLALRILRDRSEAEELAQDVFYRVWQEAASYDSGRGKPEAWLVTLTRSRAIDRLRAARRRFAAPLNEEIMNAETVPSGTGQADARLSTECALNEIAGPQRQALELAYYEGLTQTEIAARLGVPLGTVKTRIRDGLGALKKILEQKEKSLAR